MDLDANLEFTELRPFRRSLEVLVQDRTAAVTYVSHVSVYFRDLNNGPWFGVEEKEAFTPASLLKVPMLMALLDQAEEDGELLRTKVTPMGDLPRPEAGLQRYLPTQGVQPGRTYTVEELLELMIVHSDNGAKEILLDFMQPAAYQRVFRVLGLPIIDPRGKDVPVTVTQYATFFRMLYNASYLGRSMSQKALEMLARSAFKDGLVAGVPPGTTVAHKFGERSPVKGGESQLHDCGIIYHPREPYLLCVMTRGRSMPELAATIRDVSGLVYRKVDSQTRSR